MAEEVLTMRNKKKFAHNGYMYIFDQASRTDRELKFWRCDHKNRCKARVHVKDGKVVREVNPHSHEPSPTRVEVALVKTNIKKRAAETLESPTVVVSECLAAISQESKTAIPSMPALKKMIMRKRNLLAKSTDHSQQQSMDTMGANVHRFPESLVHCQPSSKSSQLSPYNTSRYQRIRPKTDLKASRILSKTTTTKFLDVTSGRQQNNNEVFGQNVTMHLNSISHHEASNLQSAIQEFIKNFQFNASSSATTNVSLPNKSSYTGSRHCPNQSSRFSQKRLVKKIERIKKRMAKCKIKQQKETANPS